MNHHIIVATGAVEESLHAQKNLSTSEKMQPMENTSPPLASKKSYQENVVREIGKSGGWKTDMREMASTLIEKTIATENSRSSSDDFLARWHRRSPTLLGKMAAEPSVKSSKAPGVENGSSCYKSPQRYLN